MEQCYKKHVRGEMIEGRKEEKLAIRSGNSGMFMKTTITTQLFCLTITVWQSQVLSKHYRRDVSMDENIKTKVRLTLVVVLSYLYILLSQLCVYSVYIFSFKYWYTSVHKCSCVSVEQTEEDENQRSHTLMFHRQGNQA